MLNSRSSLTRISRREPQRHYLSCPHVPRLTQIQVPSGCIAGSFEGRIKDEESCMRNFLKLSRCLDPKRIQCLLCIFYTYVYIHICDKSTLWMVPLYLYVHAYIYIHTYYTYILLYGFFWLSTDFPEGAAMRRLFGLSKVELFVIHQKHLKHRDF